MMAQRRLPARGVALVAVLWAVTLFSIMAGSFSLTLQRDSGLLTTVQGRAQGMSLADAAVHYAMLMQSLPDPKLRWRSDGTPYQVRLPGGEVRVRLLDEGGKIDINAAQEATLVALLTRFTGGPDEAAALSDAILDWRDPDDLTRNRGAEAKEYEAAGKGYGPTNRNFQALEELQLVRGMTPALFRRLEPLFTLYTGQDGINPAKASREALMALPGLEPSIVDQYLELRRTTPPNTPLPPLPVQPNGIRLQAVGDMAYTVLAESRLPEGEVFGVRAVIKRQRGRGGAPFAIMAWKPLNLERPDPSAPGIQPIN